MNLIAADHAEQLSWIEGFPASGHRFALRSVNNLWTDLKLAHEQQVHGEWHGIIDGVRTVRSRDGSLLYVYEVRVDDASLELASGLRAG